MKNDFAFLSDTKICLFHEKQSLLIWAKEVFLFLRQLRVHPLPAVLRLAQAPCAVALARLASVRQRFGSVIPTYPRRNELAVIVERELVAFGDGPVAPEGQGRHLVVSVFALQYIHREVRVARVVQKVALIARLVRVDSVDGPFLIVVVHIKKISRARLVVVLSAPVGLRVCDDLSDIPGHKSAWWDRFVLVQKDSPSFACHTLDFQRCIAAPLSRL